MAKAKDVMSKNVITVKKDTPIGEIVEILIKNRISGVPVVNEKDMIVGVVTEADLLYRKTAAISTSELYRYGDYLEVDEVTQEEKKASAATAEDIMTTVPVCVNEEAGVGEVVALMLEKEIKRVFVAVNEQVVGVISKSDILKNTLAGNKEAGLSAPELDKARNLMTKNLITVHKNAPVYDVIKTLLENRISGVPVVDDSNKVIGVVSESDLIYKEDSLDLKASYWSDRQKYIEEHWKTTAATAGEIMTGKVISAPPGTPVEELADMMLKHKVKRILIMENGELLGIVSRADVLSTVD